MQMITALEMCIIVSYIFQSWFAHLLLPDMRPGICFSVGLRGFKKHINDLPALKVHNISEFSPALASALCSYIPHICNFFSTYTFFGSIFFHAKARKSRQNRLRKKQRKVPQNRFHNQKQGKFQISSHLSCVEFYNSSKAKISDFSTSVV